MSADILYRIVQIDPVLCEDNRTVMLYAWTTSPDHVFISTVMLPMPIQPDAFLPDEWRDVPPDTLSWTPAW